VVLVDADLRPAVVNAHAAKALGAGRTSVLGRPLGELLTQGVEELESALTHVLAEGAPPAPAEVWVSVRTPEGERRRCWRSGFVRLSSPLAEEPRSEEHTSELQSRENLVCRLLLEKNNRK